MSPLIVILKQLDEGEAEREVEETVSVLRVAPALWPREQHPRHHYGEVMMQQPPRQDPTPVRPQHVFSQRDRAVVPHQQEVI